MFALSEGGDGAASPDKNVGGAGGGAAVTTDGSVGQIELENSTGTIATAGYGIMGMVALARGGYGASGSKGAAGGRGGDILMEMGASASLTTNGGEAYGLVGQSDGGIGGRNAAVAGDCGLGGKITAAADWTASIATLGEFPGAVVLQSLGGGGGVGADFNNVLFGSGGNGANAGQVEIVFQTAISTLGDHSSGLLAQSVGGIGAGLVPG